VIGFEAPDKLLQSLGILVDSKDFCRWVDMNIQPVLGNINTNLHLLVLCGGGPLIPSLST
jgi:hypothetical protein